MTLRSYSLAALCCFTCAAAFWLLTMENILRHPGYGQRSGIAIGIAVQSLATLYWLHNRAALLRGLVLLGSVAIVWLASAALWNVGTAGHFEGFAVIIATALLAQAVATVAAR